VKNFIQKLPCYVSHTDLAGEKPLQSVNGSPSCTELLAMSLCRYQWLAGFSSTRTENSKLSSVEGKQGAILALHFGGVTLHHAEQCHEIKYAPIVHLQCQARDRSPD
jgi:hypothetical protein